MNVEAMSMEDRLGIVVPKAAALLPADVGRRLMAFVTKESLAIMAVVVAVWAGSHFFGVGEVADVILLIAGYIAIGGAAIEGGKKLIDFAMATKGARSERDLDMAAKHLADAISIIGVTTAMALLFRKPKGVYKDVYKPNAPLPPYSKAFPKPLPLTGKWSYKPKIRFTKSRMAGEGGTSPLGDITIGRDFFPTPGAKGASAAVTQMRKALYHEKVHQFFDAKTNILRNQRLYLKMSAYKRSYVLRYVEEAMAELYGVIRSQGVDKSLLIEAVKFPVQDRYMITVAKMGAEAKGVLLGPIVVGGVTYQVFFGQEP